MIVAIGADHGGFLLKTKIAEFLKNLGHKVHDLGTYSEDPADYPDFALAVAQEILSRLATSSGVTGSLATSSRMSPSRSVIIYPC